MGTSKKLSYLLRHSDVPDEQGWIAVEKLIKEFGYTEQILRHIVANDLKHRYEFSEDFKHVRALYGHSNHVCIKYKEIMPPATLYHGTAKRFLESILIEGLKGLNRRYVHLSESIEDAIEVGKRHGTPIVLAIDTQKVISGGGVFLKSKNRIWLIKDVNPKSISILT